MNHEEIIKKGVNEALNDLFESMKETDKVVVTSKSFCNSICLWRDNNKNVIFVMCGYIETSIENPHSCICTGENSILIYSEHSNASYIKVPVEQVEKWIDEISNQTEN